MTCYERLRNNKEANNFNRLNSYFHALENNQLDTYHNHREKLKQMRLTKKER